MRIIVIGSPDLGAALAAQLHLEHLDRADRIATDGFVLEGSALDLQQARTLDAALRSRATEVDAVLWLGGGDPAVVDHYGGRVIELDGAPDVVEAALAGLREVLAA